MTNTLALMPTSSDEDNWTEDQKQLMIAAGAYRREGENLILAPASVVMAFLHQCQKSGLDPIARQIYLIYRAGKWGMQGAIDGFRVVAARHDDYDGSDAEWMDSNEQWHDVWPDTFEEDGKTRVHPTAARVKVWRKGSDRPTTGIAKWSEFAVIGRGGENWEKMPSHMLAKVAEALALRKRYPQDFSGIYTAEEMGSSEVEAHVFGGEDWKKKIGDTQSVAELITVRDELVASGEWTKALETLARSRKVLLEEQGKLLPEIVIPESEQVTDE